MAERPEEAERAATAGRAEAPVPVLEVRDLRAGYAEADIVRKVSLLVHPGAWVVVIGPNGAGKSTLLKAIVGLLKPRAGTVRFLGRDITGWAPERVARLGLGYVPQVANVFPTLTVKENLEMGAYLRRGGVAARMEQVLDEFPRLRERLGQRAHVLSGGERQMLALGKALMLDPALLLLDEPSAGLAPAVVDDIFAKVREVNARGVAVVMVEQNARKALAQAHRGYVLENGSNALEGPGPALLADPEVGRLYLGLRPRAAGPPP